MEIVEWVFTQLNIVCIMYIPYIYNNTTFTFILPLDKSTFVCTYICKVLNLIVHMFLFSIFAI